MVMHGGRALHCIKHVVYSSLYGGHCSLYGEHYGYKEQRGQVEWHPPLPRILCLRTDKFLQTKKNRNALSTW